LRKAMADTQAAIQFYDLLFAIYNCIVEIATLRSQ
jgi:hypothetical protein